MTGTGQDPFAYAHARAADVAWMSQNTNQLPTSPAVDQAIADAVARGEHRLYPPRDGVPGLKDRVLADLGLPADAWRVELTNGALEALHTLNRALFHDGDEVITTDPSFLPIHNQVSLGGARPVELPAYGGPWKLTADAVTEAVTPRTRALLLIDPLNPTGVEYTRDEVRAFADIARDHDLLLVHDVTYRDFAFNPALAGAFAPERTVYAYSLSKSCALAGLRIGALVAPGHVMDRLKPYWMGVLGVNVLAQRAAEAALATKPDWIGPMVRTARENQAIIKDAVDAIPGLHVPVYPSSANTLVVDVTDTGVDPGEVERRLLYEHDVFVRAGAYASRKFGERFFRVSFTVPREGVDRFVTALPEVVNVLTAP